MKGRLFANRLNVLKNLNTNFLVVISVYSNTTDKLQIQIRINSL